MILKLQRYVLFLWVGLIVISCLVSTVSAKTIEEKIPETMTEVKLSFAPIVRKVQGAVVNIFVRQNIVEQRQHPLFNDPIFGELFSQRMGLSRKRVQNSLGSGVVVSSDGMVVTNYHVIKGIQAGSIIISFADKTEYKADILLKDKNTDLAVLKIITEKKNFPFLQLETDETLQVGDLVLAIGNPFGVGQTVTSGIVSALSRSSIANSDYQSFIQTDAAINPGNSGGALVDMHGNLIGINTMIFSRSGGSNGIGFAIPARLVRIVLNSALKGQRVERPWLGARLQNLTRDMALSLGLNANQAGVMINHLVKASPAQQSGLKAGDVILELRGKKIADLRSFKYEYALQGIGGKVPVRYFRGGRIYKTNINLLAAPLIPKPDSIWLEGENPFSGARVANLSPKLAETYDMKDVSGIVVIAIQRGSYAASVGLRPKDILLKINGQPLQNTRQLEQFLRQGRGVWELDMKRQGRVIRLVLPG